VLTGWNALMIRGLAIAARALERNDLAEAATRALDVIRTTLWRAGRLLATSRDGRAHLNAYLDDYVYLADAILELQQVRFRADELALARELLEVVLHHFAAESGKWTALTVPRNKSADFNSRVASGQASQR